MTIDAKIFVGCCFLGMFFAGLVIGQDRQPLACPVVAGQQVVSTIDSRTEQVCHYVSQYGRAVRRVKL